MKRTALILAVVGATLALAATAQANQMTAPTMTTQVVHEHYLLAVVSNPNWKYRGMEYCGKSTEGEQVIVTYRKHLPFDEMVRMSPRATFVGAGVYQREEPGPLEPGLAPGIYYQELHTGFFCETLTGYLTNVEPVQVGPVTVR